MDVNAQLKKYGETVLIDRDTSTILPDGEPKPGIGLVESLRTGLLSSGEKEFYLCYPQSRCGIGENP